MRDYLQILKIYGERNMKKFSHIILFCLATMIVAGGCTATIGYLNENTEQFAATNPSDVQVYAERHLDREVVEIGYVSSHNTERPTGDYMKEQVRKKAASMGADAVIGFRFFGYTAEGIAVKFK